MENKQMSITIYDWMRDLGLRPLDLNVFALVWGYCEEGRVYCGTSQMMSHRLRYSDSGVRHAIARLTDMGLIAQTDEGLTVPDGTQKTGDFASETCRAAQEAEEEEFPAYDGPIVAPDVTDGAQLIEFLQTAADDLVARLNELTGDTEALRTHLIKTSDANGTRTEARVFSVYNVKNILYATRALKILVGVTCNLHNIPTLKEQNAYELARLKYELEMEKRKTQRQDPSDNKIVISFGDRPDEQANGSA